MFTSTDPAEFQFVIEVYRIPSHFNTHDLWREFDDYSRSELCLKWVNDTHALGIFACERQGIKAKSDSYVVYCIGVQSVYIRICITVFYTP